MAGMGHAMIIMMVIGDYFEGVVRVHAGLCPKQVPPSNVLRLEFVKATLLYKISNPSFRTQSNLLYTLCYGKWKRESSKKTSAEDPDNDYFGRKLPIKFCPRILSTHQ